ncbi:unnamed protein product [Somion occarium]|uniref:MFS general substrate transporter n=1 Tax=Somion occarium TaxID=3059160 RepID=A0ABP1D824_9APHY
MSDVKVDTLSSIEKAVESTPPSERSSTPELTYPEGGLKAWLAVLGAWLVQFSTFGYTQSFGVFQDFYVRDFLNNKTSSDISWIGSIQVLLVLSIGFLTGYGLDRGYFYLLNTSGSVLLVFSLFMLSLAHPHQWYQVFLAQGLGAGLGVGLTYVPALGILSHYFEKRRALVMGIASSGSCIGGIVHPIMLNRLFESVGFAKGVRASAGLNLGVLFVGCALIRTRLPPKQGIGASAIWSQSRRFVKDPAYVLTLIGSFLIVLGSFFPIFFLQLDAITRGLSPAFAFDTLAILYSGSFFGRIIPSWLSRRFGLFNTMIICTTGIVAMQFGMIGVTTVGSTIAFGILFGFFSGAFVALISPMLALFAEDISEVGARMGICHLLNGIGGFLGVPIGAALLGAQNRWWRPIVFSGCCVAVGTGLFIMARMLLVKRRGTNFL